MEQSTIVTQIITGLNHQVNHLIFLAKGSTSKVWYVETEHQPIVIRLAAPHKGKSICFEGEAGLRLALHPLDPRVAQPIASNLTHPGLLSPAVAWCADSFIEGETLTRGALPKAVCHDLGELLAKLHSLPATGYGLLVDRRDKLVGQADTVIGGICTRLQEPWPFQPKVLQEHPIAQAAPQLLPRIEPYREALLALLDNEPSVPLHTDLHERQMPTVNGRLSGLLDFGDAMIGPVICDIGSFMGFHGGGQTQWLLEGYTSDVARRKALLEQAHLWSIVTSLHHASRSVTLALPDRMQRVIQFLDENLKTL